MENFNWIQVVIISFLFLLYNHLCRFRGILENTGFPMIKPYLCFGSSPIFFNRIHLHLWFHEKHKQLGRTFTRYFGVLPVITTIDPELVKEITLKQSCNFTDNFNLDFHPGETTLLFAR